MAKFLLGTAMVVCLASWVYAATQFVGLLKHRKPDVTVSSLLTGGMKAFDPAYFEPEAAPRQRGLKRSFVVFFIGIFVAFAGVAVGIAEQEKAKRAGAGPEAGEADDPPSAPRAP